MNASLRLKNSGKSSPTDQHPEPRSSMPGGARGLFFGNPPCVVSRTSPLDRLGCVRQGVKGSGCERHVATALRKEVSKWLVAL